MLADRLRSARHARFVGRASEKQFFTEVIRQPEPPIFLYFIFGPGGVGKTTLLQEFVLIGEQHSVPCLYLDARNIEPTPNGVASAVRQAGERKLPALPARYVLMVDTVEILAPLEEWLRDEFLPGLGDNVLVVMAGRSAPSPGWRADPGWHSLMRVVPLRNLDREDSLAYLERRQVPPGELQAVLKFTHGHPLALSLVADVLAQRAELPFAPERSPDVVQALLERLTEKAPGPLHRAALEACALVRLMTETLLAQMLEREDVHGIFEWLQGLSFMEPGSEGIFPHDVAREALTTDVRWRNPEWYGELHRRARAHYFERLQNTGGAIQQRVLIDYIFLHRDNPLVRPFFEWQTGSGLIADSLQPTDMTALIAMVRQHEGDEAGRLTKFWLSRQPDNVVVVRDSQRNPLGFVLMLAVDRIIEEELDIDPAVRAVRAFLQHQYPLRPGERATIFRFWLAADTYQDVSPVQTQLFVIMVRHYLTTPRLAYTFIPCADPDFYLLAFSYADLHRLPQADFTLDGRRYGVYGHDWRIVPPIPWLELMGSREVTTSASATPPPPIERVIVLSEAEFADAVQQALREYTRADALTDSPLLRSKLVMDRGSQASEAERARTLRTLLREAAESLQRSPREAKFYRALYHTYIQPAPTQEQAAEILDVPFSSYRRHLKSGVQRVTELLWAQEIGMPVVDGLGGDEEGGQ